MAPQTLNLNLKLSLPNLKARQTDKLIDTVDYGELARCLIQKANQTEYFLIEKLAQVLADTCLEFDARIQKVELELEKLGCIENARSAVFSLKTLPSMSPRT